MIETRLLQQFIAVAEELHFNRAAERLHMAQPPLSQAIRKLEGAVGAPLFERTPRSVALTPAGAAFLETARRTVQSLEEGVAQTRRVAQGMEGHLTLTFINIAPYASLLQALRHFRELNPGIAFTMREATTQEQVNALEQGEADIGFMRTPGTTTPHLRMERLLSERICVALPAGHPLAAKAGIDLALLRDEAFVASPRTLGKGFHDQLIGLCQTAGFVPDIVQHGRQMQTLIALVAAGFGIALLPASLATETREDVMFRPLQVEAAEDVSRLELFMAWNETRTSAIRDRLIQAILQTRSLP
ncbi:MULTISPECIES: LysR substrate-binding domain-containing protein [Stenotrophomonas]|uniref:LysR substrate-binding domain-containing protein n=1 Tax=Stenotrophomonas bentonitica TaxID=1450134 RepID=A0ABU9JQE0_9GAMM|nr:MULTISPECIES: LysR substrate-binding domain-containing protein [Stenotrophomonas]MDX5517378.1 LysR substrate-binding domain-containing protein [Stenotrophomonas sp. RG-453]